MKEMYQFLPSIIISYVMKDSKIVYSNNNRHEFTNSDITNA